jgi:hypothetical protein
MRRLLTAALVVVLASFALVSAGCMGDDGNEASSTAEWADAFCTAINGWTDEIERVGSQLSSSLSADSLEQAADDLSTATDDLVEEVEELGPPETESGEEIEEAIKGFADAAETEKAEVEEAVEDASGATGIAAALGAAGSSLQTMAAALQTMFQAFEDADAGGELETAFEDSAACDEIGA